MKSKKKKILKFGLPKGSLQEATFQKLAKAGFNVSASSRSYLPYVDDEEMEIRLIRAQEVSRYVEHGYLDCGITGHDWVIENGSKVHEVGEFLFSKATRQAARWVLAVPEASSIKSVKDLEGKSIATEVVNITKKYLRKNKVKADVEFSWDPMTVICASSDVDVSPPSSMRDLLFPAASGTIDQCIPSIDCKTEVLSFPLCRLSLHSWPMRITFLKLKSIG